MEQEVVMSAECINYISENYHQFDFKSEGALFLQKLQSDFLCLDNNRKLDDEYEARIIELNDDALFSAWPEIIEKIEKIIRYDVSNSKSIKQLESKIARKSNDKIWINPNLEKETKTILKKKFGKTIKPISHKNYLNPSTQDIIVHNNVRFELTQGDIFPIMKWLKPCLIGASFVTIQDGYLVKDLPKSNLKKIIQMVPLKTNLKIKTLTDLARCRHADDGFSVIQTEQEIKTVFPNREIEFVTTDSKRNLRQRKIETNKWNIDIGHGLDSFKNGRIEAETSFGLKLK